MADWKFGVCSCHQGSSGDSARISGKTKMMSLLVAWSVLNALREGAEHLGMGPQAIIVAPGLFVKERRVLAASAPPP